MTSPFVTLPKSEESVLYIALVKNPTESNHNPAQLHSKGMYPSIIVLM